MPICQPPFTSLNRALDDGLVISAINGLFLSGIKGCWFNFLLLLEWKTLTIGIGQKEGVKIKTTDRKGGGGRAGGGWKRKSNIGIYDGQMSINGVWFLMHWTRMDGNNPSYQRSTVFPVSRKWSEWYSNYATGIYMTPAPSPTSPHTISMSSISLTWQHIERFFSVTQFLYFYIHFPRLTYDKF